MRIDQKVSGALWGRVVLGVLHTRRLRLEPLEEAHAKALFAGLRHDALYEFTSDRAPESVETLARRYRRLATRVSPDGRESWLNWALWSVPDGCYVGLVQATVHPNRTAYMAHVLFHTAWGKGYAREASAALIDCLYYEWGVRDIWASVDTRNRRSIALLERLGFLRIAARENAEMIRGALSDEYIYCLSLDPPSFHSLD
jgi:ribosomal-protein-alanine N-acetyltransferase